MIISAARATAPRRRSRCAAPSRRRSPPPAHHRADRPRPRLQRAVPVPGDAEVLAGRDSAARVDDDRRQRALVRVDPDHVARPICAPSIEDRPGPTTCLPPIASLPAYRCDGSADNIPSGHTAVGADASIRSARTLEGTNRGRHSEQGHRYPGQDLRRVRPRFGLRPHASRHPRRNPITAPGSEAARRPTRPLSTITRSSSPIAGIPHGAPRRASARLALCWRLGCAQHRARCAPRARARP